jgi:ankyrin repeat protein
LLKAKSPIDTKTSSNGDTPLHLCAEKGKTEFVQFLLDSGADKDIQNSGNKTAYDLSKEKSFKETMDLLKPAGGGGGCCTIM